jgi:hypothetical protein
MFSLTLSHAETQELVSTLVHDQPVQEMPSSRGKNFTARVKGLKHLDAEGMFLLAVVETEHVRKKENLRTRLTDKFFGVPGLERYIQFTDIVNPERSIAVTANDTPKSLLGNRVIVVAGAPGTAETDIREPNLDDADIIFGAVLTMGRKSIDD